MPDQVHLFVSGRVQGVGFRQAVLRQAFKHGLTGWVRNLEDGRVEAVLQGNADAQNALIEWCAQGPALSHVDSVRHIREPVDETCGAFELRA